MATRIPPAANAALVTWTDNFYALVSANPQLFGLTAADAATITLIDEQIDTAYLAIKTKALKSKTKTATWQATKAACVPVLAAYAQTISNNPAVTVANKVSIGVSGKIAAASPVTQPLTFPVLSWRATINKQVLCDYYDSGFGPTSKQKPYGVIGCTVWVTNEYVANQEITDVFDYFGNITTSPFAITLDPYFVGTRIWVVARWITATTQPGPWGPVINGVYSG